MINKISSFVDEYLRLIRISCGWTESVFVFLFLSSSLFRVELDDFVRVSCEKLRSLVQQPSAELPISSSPANLWDALFACKLQNYQVRRRKLSFRFPQQSGYHRSRIAQASRFRENHWLRWIALYGWKTNSFCLERNLTNGPSRSFKAILVFLENWVDWFCQWYARYCDAMEVVRRVAAKW